MIQTVQRITAARRTLHDWLGEGGEPVPKEQAQARADVCNHGGKDGNKCPKNYQGGWLWNMATSMAINAQMGLKQALNLHVDGEETLMVCEACGCQLKLKVQVPFEHIYRHTHPDTFEKFPSFCWLRTELAKSKQNP